MRNGLIWVVLLIAAAAVGWMVFGGGGDGGGGGHDAGGLPDDGPVDTGPALKGAGGLGSTAPRVPGDLRGGCMIQGTARRGGEAVPATIELRHVQEIDPRDPFKGGIETQFIARLLDGGMSSKDVIARRETEGDGTYRFQGLATGLYELRATVADGAMGFTTAALPADGARVEAVIDIPEGDQSLVGRITYADGKPFQGSVLASAGNAFAMMMGMGSKSMPAYTDADGRFKIAGLNPGQYQISALIPGVMRVMGAPIKVPYAGEYTLTINATGTEVKGKVIDAETEEAIGGATVFGGGGDPESSFAIFTTKSAADGSFALTIPTGRGGGMFVRADGYAAQTLDFNSGRGVDDLVMVSLLRLAKLSGRVTAKEGGAPVAGITVFAMGSGGRGMGPAPASAVTDADGRYRIEGIDPGSVRAWAIGGGHASAGMSGTGMGPTDSPYSAELEPGQEGTLDLEAVVSGAVEGTVSDESGRAIGGAIVQAGGQGGMPPQFAAAFMGMGASFGTAVTDTDGRYRIDVLVPATSYKVTVKAPEHPTVTSDSFIAVGGKTETVDVTMKAPRWIDVTVVEQDGGAPVAGAAIMAIPKSGGREMMMELIGGGAMWSTNAAGTTRIGPLAAGELAMQVKAPGYIDEDGIEISADEKGPLTVELKKGLVIAGSVKLPEGVPVQGVTVTVNRSGGSSGWFHERAVVQADGTWRVDTIEEEGEYNLRARGAWKGLSYTADGKASTGQEDVVLELVENKKEAQQTITVTVLDADGKAVPTGRVRLIRFSGNGSSSSRTRLSAGKAQIRGFNTGDGEAEIWVEVYELIGSKRGATIQGPVTIVDGALEVRLGEPRSVSGLVVDGGGKGVPGVKVSAQAIHPARDDRNGQTHGTAVSDTEGRFEVKGLGDLEYRLSFETPADYTPVESQTVRAGASNVRATATMGMRARLTVLGFDGKPIAGAYVWAQRLDEEGNTIGGMRYDGSNLTSSEGAITLRGLEGGASYQLSINPPDGREDLKRVEVKPWKPGDETFTFERAYTITGLVVDKSGKPLGNVRVQKRKTGEARFSGWHRTDANGRFTINQLEAGEYELRVRSDSAVTMAQPGGRAAESPGFVKARAGATGVKLIADLGLELVVRIRGGKASDRMRQAFLRTGDGQALNGTWRSSTVLAFQGLREGSTYTLWVWGLEDGKYAARQGIEGRGGDIEVEAQAGGVIEGTIKLPVGQTFRNVHVSAANPLGQSAVAQVNTTTGTFRIEGLPHDQTYQLHAHGWTNGGGHWQGQASGKTGANVTIELKTR